MTANQDFACAECGRAHDEGGPRTWLLRIYRAVEGAKPVSTIYLPGLADDVEEMAARIKGLEK